MVREYSRGSWDAIHCCTLFREADAACKADAYVTVQGTGNMKLEVVLLTFGLRHTLLRGSGTELDR
jgi:hypothetical protein